MTTTNLIVFIIGVIASLLAGSYLMYEGLRHKSNLLETVRTIYVLLALLEFYYCSIYIIVLLGILLPTNYGVYLRPVASVLVLSPAIVAFLNRLRR